MYFRRKTGLRARLGLFCLTAFLRAAKVIANQSGARANAADADRARQKRRLPRFRSAAQTRIHEVVSLVVNLPESGWIKAKLVCGEPALKKW